MRACWGFRPVVCDAGPGNSFLSTPGVQPAKANAQIKSTVALARSVVNRFMAILITVMLGLRFHHGRVNGFIDSGRIFLEQVFIKLVAQTQHPATVGVVITCQTCCCAR